MKAALLTLDQRALHALLQLPFDIEVRYAQMDYTLPGQPALQLVIMGESLAEDFRVREGERTRAAMLVMNYDADTHHRAIRIQAI